MRRFVALVALSILVPTSPAWAGTASGTVVDGAGKPIHGVRVRITAYTQGSKPVEGTEVVSSGADGSFSLGVNAGGGQIVAVSFGKKGYYNTAKQLYAASNMPLGKVVMNTLGTIDNDHYQWIKPNWPKMDQTDFGCNACHGQQADDWQKSKMAHSAKNPRVFSLYKGTDISGNPVGGGYRDDNPDKAGPCANCHAPAAAINAPGETRLDLVEGVAKEGVFCDFCHKIRDVKIGAGLGVGGAVQVQRQPAWLNLFAFGPFDNYLGGPMLTTFNPLLTQSRFCGGCHQYTNENGVKVQTTYSEWAEMSGADPDALQCQDCHMKKKFGKEYQGEDPGVDYILNDEHMQQMHGTLHPKSKIYPHTFHGAAEYITEAASLAVTAEQVGGEVIVKATIDNVNAGHALPTGMPFRHMILEITATADGAPMVQVAGPKVPDYGGVGSAPEDLAGKPGKGFARVLGDETETRNVPFWRATREIEDTRIGPADSDEVELRFEPPEAGGAAKISARLIYRRAFRKMVLERKWDSQGAAKDRVKDVVMNAAEADVTLTPWVKTKVEPTDAGGDGGASGDSSGDDSGCTSAGAAGPGSPGGSPWLVLGLALLAGLIIRRRRFA